MQHGICDSHAHLTSSELLNHVEAVLARAQAAGLTTIINICTDEESLRLGLELSKRYPWVHHAAAVHPHDAQKLGPTYFPIVAQHARQKAIVAIGETGLDYHYHHSTKEAQQHYLRQHLQLALECALPVVIHCREAFQDLFQILDQEYTQGKGVLHCFTGTLVEAQQVLDRDFYLSLSGIVTFKKSAELREVAKLVPLDRLLIETDAPYLAPQSKRGHPNEPAYVVETAQVIATVKGITFDELIQATSQNAQRLFQMD